MKQLLFSVLLLISPSLGEEAKLPSVLIIGDSISMGYHKTVVRELEGKADVSRIPGNGQYSGFGIANIEKWLGDKNWDVIHFNWGLWDIYGWKYHDQDRTPKAYAQRLETLVKRMHQTGATLIWATTTPVCPEPEVSMRKRWDTEVIIPPSLELQYRNEALEVMKRHKVRINDLYELIRPDLKKYSPKPDDVHFTREGSEVLGKQVAEAILQALQERSPQPH